MSQHILIVDDEESIRYTFSRFLLAPGRTVEVAHSYEEALEKLTTCAFDLIFCDILLGGRSGINLLEEVRRRGLYLPVVMITGAPEVDSATEALRLGAYDYLAKPVRREALLRIADKALQYKALRDEKEKLQADLQAVFRSVKDAILTTDGDLRLVQANAAAGRLCGISAARAGESLDQLAPCADRCLGLLRQSLESRRTLERERIECVHPRHGRRIVSVSASPLRGAQGEHRGAMLVVRDETRLDALERRIGERSSFHGLVGTSAPMQEVYALLETLAEVPTTVLITGESGTGKELVARALHDGGPRRDGPLIRVNCAALSENLLESELFGHVRGAFTGAVKDKVGRFEAAHGGTLFLDEIGDITPALQLRLLRVLQEKEIERVGANRSIPVDVRVVAATNQNLTEKIRRGEFREDLFYRLKVVTVKLPPLRERREDIAPLAAHFLAQFNEKLGRDIRDLSPEAHKALLAHPWPGNVRELQHALEHACILCRNGRIEVAHLPAEIITAAATADQAISPAAIQRALHAAGGNKTQAARMLGISRRTVYRKLEEDQG
ncbi:sigma-54 dependent transcriptional regulator [Geoalkalibacter halelectricus]|uniref:Sigma 54-interacting transcriptional regulator n=1 Tax=Geoalkalibacter halelectricus TaxID=2847045 RepID=A0ABY5ZML9_9BACT|nr:sigma-54-dependent Fis family transcriptional regulator [Geoalkalibacter halelectricus]MDO3378716.1 sigma 54-interacting transcriptional regulator [Geoalkalibacter halelectricus]UWZ79976.1 sigma 54-interacting transcriptional regulator [Geoalkalibacter halelectricus]